jgi:hypothetical protein
MKFRGWKSGELIPSWHSRQVFSEWQVMQLICPVEAAAE